MARGHDDVDAGLERAGADQGRVARRQVGAHHAGDLEGVLVVGHGGDGGMVEHEVEGPADVGVGVAQPRQHGGAGQVDRLDGRRIDWRPSPEDAGDPVALDEQVAVEGLGRPRT